MTLSVRDSARLVNLSTTLPGELQTLDFLAAEALAHQPHDIQASLLKTSILDRFCASLCEVVCISADGKETLSFGGDRFIQWLTASNLFVIPLDDHGQWFRYHHLFQELLQSQLESVLEADEIAELHIRASEWFESQDLIEEAIQHALAAGDISYAVHLVKQHRYDLMNTEQWKRLERWLERLPPELILEDPMLLSTRAWIFEYNSQLAEAWALMDTVEMLLEFQHSGHPLKDEIRGEINTLRAEQYYIGLDGAKALFHGQEGLRLLNPEAKSLLAFSYVFQALSYQMTGDLERGLDVLGLAMSVNSIHQGTSYHTRMQIALCSLFAIEGNLTRLQEAALQCLKLGELYNLHESIIVAKQALGVVHYHRNELTEVEKKLKPVVDNPYIGRPLYVINCAFALALSYSAQKRAEDAWRIVDSMHSFATQKNYILELALIRAFQVELALRQGNIKDAQQRSQGVSYELLPPFWFFYEPQLTQAKLLLAQNTSESLKEAVALLDRFLGLLNSIHNTRFQIDALALQALTLDARGDRSAALEMLGKAVILAEPGTFIRNYVDLGPPMAALLKRL